MKSSFLDAPPGVTEFSGVSDCRNLLFSKCNSESKMYPVSHRKGN